MTAQIPPLPSYCSKTFLTACSSVKSHLTTVGRHSALSCSDASLLFGVDMSDSPLYDHGANPHPSSVSAISSHHSSALGYELW